MWGIWLLRIKRIYTAEKEEEEKETEEEKEEEEALRTDRVVKGFGVEIMRQSR